MQHRPVGQTEGVTLFFSPWLRREAGGLPAEEHGVRAMGFSEAALRCPIRDSQKEPRETKGRPGLMRIGAPSVRLFLIRLRPRRAGLRSGDRYPSQAMAMLDR